MDLMKSAQTASGKRNAARRRGIEAVVNKVSDAIEAAVNDATANGEVSKAYAPAFAAFDEGLAQLGTALIAEHERANELDRRLAEREALTKSRDAAVAEAVAKVRLPEGTRVLSADGALLFEVDGTGMLKPEPIAKLADPVVSFGDVMTRLAKRKVTRDDAIVALSFESALKE